MPLPKPFFTPAHFFTPAPLFTPAKAGARFRADRTERFYGIDHLLRERGVVPVGDFLRELEVSLATFKRDIEYMRSRHHAPIEWDREAGGYRFVKPDSATPVYELPGLRFSPREAQALLTMQHLLESLEPTLLGAHLAPLKSPHEVLLSTGKGSISPVPMGVRKHEPKHFELIASAVRNRAGQGAGRGARERVRDLLGEVAAVGFAEVTPGRERYVAMEEWNPKQRSKWLTEARYVLEIPFSSQKELAMDVLRVGADVEVVVPKELREMRRRVEALKRLYR